MEAKTPRIDTKDSNAVLDELTCPVCLAVPRQGGLVLCVYDHVLCEGCHKDLDGLAKKLCPTCREEYPPQAKRSRLLDNILDRVKVPCKYSDHGCEVEQPRQRLALEHETICPFRTVDCGNDGCESTYLAMEKEELVKHAANCKHRSVSCRYAGEGCPTRLAFHEETSHALGCVHRTVRCRYASEGCTKSGKIHEIVDHERNCLYQKVVCPLCLKDNASRFAEEAENNNNSNFTGANNNSSTSTSNNNNNNNNNNNVTDGNNSSSRNNNVTAAHSSSSTSSTCNYNSSNSNNNNNNLIVRLKKKMRAQKTKRKAKRNSSFAANSLSRHLQEKHPGETNIGQPGKVLSLKPDTAGSVGIMKKPDCQHDFLVKSTDCDSHLKLSITFLGPPAEAPTHTASIAVVESVTNRVVMVMTGCANSFNCQENIAMCVPKMFCGDESEYEFRFGFSHS